MGAYQLTVAIPEGLPADDIPSYVDKVMAPYKGYWWDWFDLGTHPGGWGYMSYIGLDGEYVSQHLPDAIALDGEKGDYLPLDDWQKKLEDWVESLPEGTQFQDVRVHW